MNEKGEAADQPGREQRGEADDQEAAMAQEVLRRQERHREGGQDSEPDLSATQEN